MTVENVLIVVFGGVFLALLGWLGHRPGQSRRVAAHHGEPGTLHASNSPAASLAPITFDSGSFGGGCDSGGVDAGSCGPH